MAAGAYNYAGLAGQVLTCVCVGGGGGGGGESMVSLKPLANMAGQTVASICSAKPTGSNSLLEK